MKYFIVFIVLLSLVFSGYVIGQYMGKKEAQKMSIENYSLVKDIAELASLEANGISQFKSTNVQADAGFLEQLKNKFLENTIQINIPFTAKFGFNLNDSCFKISKKDSIVWIHFPEPQLLSYELRLDKMETADKRGWLQFQQNDDFVNFQKTMYENGKKETATNPLYLQKSKEKLTSILNKYYTGMGLTLKVAFGKEGIVQKLN